MNDSQFLNCLEGKIVMSAELRSFPDGRGGEAYDPLITFTDGTQISFAAQQTDVDEYGIEPIVLVPGRTGRLIRRE